MVCFLQAVAYDMTTTVVIAIFLYGLCTLLGFGKACGQSEYKSAVGECCPMCNIGSVVRSDCRDDLSTTCQPCAPGTFMSEPNGLHKCFICGNCDENQGIYIQSKCTTIKDTVCDVLDGYHCVGYSNSQCRHALKHSVCEKGQETKTPGTKNSDTVCVNCTAGFYSPSGLKCIKWTDCTANEIQTENGSSVKDVTCTPKRRERYGLIFPMVLTLLALFYIILHPHITGCKLKVTHPVEETSANPAQNTPEENNVSVSNLTVMPESLHV